MSQSQVESTRPQATAHPTGRVRHRVPAPRPGIFRDASMGNLEGPPGSTGLSPTWKVPAHRDPSSVIAHVSKATFFPPAESLIEDFASKATVTMFLGPSQAGKTATMVAMAYAIGALDEFAGNKVLAHGSTLYVARQDPSGVVQRIRAAEAFHGHESSCYLWDTRGEPLLLDDARSVTAFIGSVTAAQEESLLPALQVIVIDTLSVSLSHSDENSNSDMRVVMENLHRIAEKTGASVWVAHHTTKSANNQSRGAGCLVNDADEVFMVQRSGKGPQAVTKLQRSAVRSALAGTTIELDLVPVASESFDGTSDQVVAVPRRQLTLGGVRQEVVENDWVADVLSSGPMSKSGFLAAFGKEFGAQTSKRYLAFARFVEEGLIVEKKVAGSKQVYLQPAK